MNKSNGKLFIFHFINCDSDSENTVRNYLYQLFKKRNEDVITANNVLIIITNMMIIRLALIYVLLKDLIIINTTTLLIIYPDGKSRYNVFTVADNQLMMTIILRGNQMYA